MRAVSCSAFNPRGLDGTPQHGPSIRRHVMHGMNGNGSTSRRWLSARRATLLATTIVGFAAATLLVAPNVAPKLDLFGGAAQAQNLSEKAQQLAQKPVGFADIVEKVKPAVISVRVKMERPANSGANNEDQDTPFTFPPGSPFERFFKSFGMHEITDGPEGITGTASGFFISSDGYAVTNNHVVQN